MYKIYITPQMLFLFLVVALIVAFPDLAFAADPSDEAESLVEEVYDFLTGKWTVGIVACCIAVGGFLTWRGVVPTSYFVSLLIGSVVVYASSTIANWIYDAVT